MELKLVGKRALVTGSSSGIGAEVARKLAREGAQVIVHGRSRERAESVATEIAERGGDATVVLGDLDRSDTAEEVAEAARRAFDGIDIVVNNAGGRIRADLPVDWMEVPADVWTETYNRNVTSAVRMCLAFMDGMRDSGWGRFIHISSYSAQSTSGGVAEYAASKSALVNLSLGLAKRLSNTGVTVNTVSPGVIRTSASDEWLRGVAAAQGFGDDIDKAIEWVLSNTVKQTVNRMGTPADVANVIAFLSSPNADFINGANIRVDGGAAPSVN